MSLNEAVLVKDEDAGDAYASNLNLKVPDFHLVLEDGNRLMVEVKSVHPKTPLGGFSMSSGEANGLISYCALVGAPAPFVAVYWTWWNLWTLVPISSLVRRGGRQAIDLPQALIHNHMSDLGDYSVGTLAPLALTLYSDPAKPRSIGADGRFPFTVGHADYSVQGKVITKPEEQRIAHLLMMYGGWGGGEPSVEEVGGEAISISFSVEPDEPVEGQEFQLHSPVSSMISTAFNVETLTSEGEVAALDARSERPMATELIPDDYDGVDLALWRFRLLAGGKSPGTDQPDE